MFRGIEYCLHSPTMTQYSQPKSNTNPILIYNFHDFFLDYYQSIKINIRDICVPIGVYQNGCISHLVVYHYMWRILQ